MAFPRDVLCGLCRLGSLSTSDKLRAVLLPFVPFLKLHFELTPSNCLVRSLGACVRFAAKSRCVAHFVQLVKRSVLRPDLAMT